MARDRAIMPPAKRLPLMSHLLELKIWHTTIFITIKADAMLPKLKTADKLRQSDSARRAEVRRPPARVGSEVAHAALRMNPPKRAVPDFPGMRPIGRGAPRVGRFTRRAA